jgi:hypothetical protein
VPNDLFVDGFCAYRPDQNDPALVDLWNRNIGADCAARVASYRNILKTHGKLGQVFRYHSLEGLVGRLSQEKAAAAQGVV